MIIRRGGELDEKPVLDKVVHNQSEVRHDQDDNTEIEESTVVLFGGSRLRGHQGDVVLRVHRLARGK